MSIAPGDPTLWFGVMFIRKGPYSSAIIRFQISFTQSFPRSPPLITFSTDMFHPLVTPLTTYMYTTESQNIGTVSASDDGRLPPGSFSLQHGFPGWFGKDVLKKEKGYKETPSNYTQETHLSMSENKDNPSSGEKLAHNIDTEKTPGQEVGIYELLRYIRSTFDNEDVLDQIPLHTASNPGAWHAWRTYRKKQDKIKMTTKNVNDVVRSEELNNEKILPSSNLPLNFKSKDSIQKMDGSGILYTKTKKPGEWNWDGVWEVRVKKCVEASVSEGVLFGKCTADDLIRFLHLDNAKIDELKENIKRSLENLELSRSDFSDFSMTS